MSTQTQELPVVQRRHDLRGFLFTILPLLLLAAPLFFHQSANAVWCGYSRAYGLGLLVLVFCICALGALVGWRCKKARKLSPAFKLLVPVGLLFLGALFTEVALRITAPDSFSEYRHWGHKRSLLMGFVADGSYSWRTPSEAGGWVEYHTDPFGFRVNRNTPNWYEQSARTNLLVFTLGESSVFGLSLNDDETWPHQLEVKLRTQGHPVTVVNAGNNGHNSLQLLLRLYLQILPHKPDCILAYFAFNDVSRQPLAPDAIALEENVAFTDSLACYARARHAGKNIYCRTLLYYHLTYTIPKRLLARFLGPEGYDQMKATLKKDAFTRSKSVSWSEFKRAWQRVREMRREGKKPEEQNPAEDTIITPNGQRYLQNLRTMVDVCNRQKVRFVPVTFACDSQRIDAYTRKCIEHYNGLVRQLARDENLPLVDLAQAFARLGDVGNCFLADHYHPSRAGAEKIAELLSESYPQWGSRAAASP